MSRLTSTLSSTLGTAFMALSLSLLLACGGATEAPAADDVSRAARVALAVQSGVAEAEALKAEGLSAEQLDGMLYDIAADPAQSEAYATLLGR
ncbi:MAG: hypothetical protein IPN01_24880 [Deltaproteobacteria bacterium]|nr:hypothetical protein [Deltaproteobacteria bacterium]